MRITCFKSLNQLSDKKLYRILLFKQRYIFSVIMAQKFVEHESKRCSKRKRGLSHYRKKNPVAKLPKLEDDDINATDYYFENGLRKVYPYFYNFSSYVKGRWQGRTIYDVFTNEFKGVHNFQEVIDHGLLTVNGKPVTADHVLNNHMYIEHKTHRHENPVIACPLEIITDTPDILVINKPSSIPVHPCGRYRFNSVTKLLAKEYGYKNLRTLYRLDRLTSGVLILPKTTTVSVKLEKQLVSKQLLKEYVCRVEGEFPEGTIACKEPIGVISLRMGVSAVRPDGKECLTTFTRLSYNGTSSVVKCVPHTGRTHQIRVHLQYLGYPILNDPVYNSTAFGAEKGKGGKIDKSLEELERILGKWHNTSEWILGDNPDYQEQFVGDKSSSDCDKHGPNTDTPQSEGKDSNVIDSGASEVCDVGKVTETEEVQDGTAKLDGDQTEDCNDTKDNKVYQPLLNTSVIDQEDAKQSCDTISASTEISDATAVGLSDESGDNDKDKSPAGQPCESTSQSTDHPSSDGTAVDISDKSTRHESSDITDIDVSDECEANNKDKCPAGSLVTTENWEAYVASKPLDKSRYTLEETCHICKALYKEPTSRELILFLHAVRYKGPDWEYSTSLPDWAAEDWADEDQYRLEEKTS